ncbi:MAG: hypothetical protein R3B07_15420 [Polyangiaceae bacterium]
MTDLNPLFSEIPISSHEALAIAGALRDIAESDGMHEEELAMITELVQGLDEDLGLEEPSKVPAITPAELAVALGEDPALKTLAMQCAVMLAMADGKISKEEAERLEAYRAALGFSVEQYSVLEKGIVGWIKAGDLSPMF